MPPQAVWELELPDLPFTAADLVGRYFRNTRLNWKPLIMLFVVPSFLYEVARSILTWIAGHSAKVSGGWMAFPYLATCVLNGFFIALIIRRNLTVVQAMRRFAYVLTRWTGFVIGYTALSVIVYFAISLSATLLGLVEMVPALFSGQAREFLVFVTAFISSCLEAPVGAFVYATVPLSGAYLDYQSGVVLEGADLQNKLSKLRR